MSAKIKPSFTADGKRYELTYTRALQCEYQKITDEKKKDKEYQRNIAEYARLQSKYERLHEAYLQAESEFFDDPRNEKLRENYSCLESMEKRAFDEFSSYAGEHEDGDGREFVLCAIGKLVLLALQEQYKLDEKESKAIWNKYKEENGDMGAMLFLSCVGAAWFTDTSEDNDNPFIQAQMERIKTANNR